MDKTAILIQLCRQYDVQILYLFGSRALAVKQWLESDDAPALAAEPDVDVGVKTAEPLSITQKVKFAIALEDLFGVNRVDLVSLADADPFLAANIIRGERVFADDEYLADEYDLYVLRRAGDLIPLERERQRLILERGA